MLRCDYDEKNYNLIRLLEFVLCLACFILTISIFLSYSNNFKENMAISIILIFVPGLYIFITLVDTIATSLLRPTAWTTWILFDVGATLSFFLCTGLLISLHFIVTSIYVTCLIVYCLTGILFLLEMFGILRDLLPTDFRESKDTLVTIVCNKPSVSCASTKFSAHFMRHLVSDKAIQCPGQDFPSIDKSIQCTCKTPLKKGKFSCNLKRFPAHAITSHGGTFHVSKDVAPILDSDLLCRSIFPCSCRVANPLQLRTVSVSARTIPKQNSEKACNTTVNTQTEDDTVSQNWNTLKRDTEEVFNVFTNTEREKESKQQQTSDQHIIPILPTLNECACYHPKAETKKSERICYPCPYIKDLSNCKREDSKRFSRPPRMCSPKKYRNTPSPKLLSKLPHFPRPLSGRYPKKSYFNEDVERVCCDCFMQGEFRESDEEESLVSVDNKKSDFLVSSPQSSSIVETCQAGCKKEEHCSISTDEGTILPGATDRTPPPTTARAKECTRHQHQVPSTVNHDKTKISKLSPRQHHVQTTTQKGPKRRRQQSCLVT